MTDTHPGGRASMIFLTTVVLPDPVPPAIPIIYMLRVFVDRLSLPVRRVSPCHGAHLFSISAKLVDFLHTLYGLGEEIHVFIDVAS